jgi:hypothetical protein
VSIRSKQDRNGSQWQKYNKNNQKCIILDLRVLILLFCNRKNLLKVEMSKNAIFLTNQTTLSYTASNEQKVQVLS